MPRLPLASSVFSLILPCLLLFQQQTQGAPSGKPNVVFILLDDLNHYSLSAYGAEKLSSTQDAFEPTALHTPRIDRLAETGVRCDQAYAYPICEPTRVALMTGMHNGRNFIKPKSLHASQITFGDVFKRAGYATGMFGKWKQTRGTRDSPGLTYISEFGWDDYSCFDVVGENYRHIDPDIVRNGKKLKLPKINPDTGRRWYGPDICNQDALKFIDEHKDQPFLLYYPMLLVHDEHTPTPDSMPKSVYDDFDTKGSYPHGAMPGDHRRYFPDMLAYTDKLIGKIIDKLDEHHLREKTLVVVMGDNGAKESFAFTMNDGRVLLGGKGHNRDSGEHVPLIFNRPGTIPAGKNGKVRSYEGIVDVTDLYPTLLDASGIPIPNPDKIDGISAWPALTGRQQGHHRDAVYEWYNHASIRDLSNKIEYAFTPEFKRYAPHRAFPEGRFFDLRNDRLEEAGTRGPKVSWANYHYSGLDLDELTDEQQRAYDSLGEVLDAHRYRPVEYLKITNNRSPLPVGGTRQLECRIIPAGATRNNLIWESSHPEIATIDKFGLLTARAPGNVEIKVYSWDDALPLADGPKADFNRDGIQDLLSITVSE